MITYIDSAGKKQEVKSPYHIDIIPEIVEAGRKIFPDIAPGWFKKGVSYPACVFYLTSSVLTDYISNKPTTAIFNYTFVAHGTDDIKLNDLFADLREKLSQLYNAREHKLPDSFEGDVYVRQTEFKFRVRIGGM